MVKKSKKQNEILDNDKKYFEYKGRPIIRSDNCVYYGKNDEKYYICCKLEKFEKQKSMRIATLITVKLMTNEGENSKLVKQTKRENLKDAIELSEEWLLDALTNH